MQPRQVGDVRGRRRRVGHGPVADRGAVDPGVQLSAPPATGTITSPVRVRIGASTNSSPASASWIAPAIGRLERGRRVTLPESVVAWRKSSVEPSASTRQWWAPKPTARCSTRTASLRRPVARTTASQSMSVSSVVASSSSGSNTPRLSPMPLAHLSKPGPLDDEAEWSMTETTKVALGMVTLDCRRPPGRGDLLVGAAGLGDPRGRGRVRDAEGNGPGAALGFGKVPDYEPPTWPNDQGSKQFHFDLKTGDIAAAEQRCVELGATVARRPARRDVAGAARPGGTSVLPDRRGELGLTLAGVGSAPAVRPDRSWR